MDVQCLCLFFLLKELFSFLSTFLAFIFLDAAYRKLEENLHMHCGGSRISPLSMQCIFPSLLSCKKKKKKKVGVCNALKLCFNYSVNIFELWVCDFIPKI